MPDYPRPSDLRWLQTGIQNNLRGRALYDFLMGLSQAGHAPVHASFGGGTQTVPNATPTVVEWPVIEDPENAWDGAGHFWTCPKDGWYRIECNLQWYDVDEGGTAGSTRNANIQIDRGGGFINDLDFGVVEGAIMPAGPVIPRPIYMKWAGQLSAGDKIRIRTRMDGEGADREIGDFDVLDLGTNLIQSWMRIARDTAF